MDPALMTLLQSILSGQGSGLAGGGIQGLLGNFLGMQNEERRRRGEAVDPLTDIEPFRVNPFRGFLAQNGGPVSADSVGAMGGIFASPSMGIIPGGGGLMNTLRGRIASAAFQQMPMGGMAGSLPSIPASYQMDTINNVPSNLPGGAGGKYDLSQLALQPHQTFLTPKNQPFGDPIFGNKQLDVDNRYQPGIYAAGGRTDKRRERLLRRKERLEAKGKTDSGRYDRINDRLADIAAGGRGKTNFGKALRGAADFQLSMLGMDNVVQDSFVDRSNFLNSISEGIGSIGQAALPIVAPGVGSAIVAGTSGINALAGRPTQQQYAANPAGMAAANDSAPGAGGVSGNLFSMLQQSMGSPMGGGNLMSGFPGMGGGFFGMPNVTFGGQGSALGQLPFGSNFGSPFTPGFMGFGSGGAVGFIPARYRQNGGPVKPWESDEGFQSALSDVLSEKDKFEKSLDDDSIKGYSGLGYKVLTSNPNTDQDRINKILYDHYRKYGKDYMRRFLRHQGVSSYRQMTGDNDLGSQAQQLGLGLGMTFDPQFMKEAFDPQLIKKGIKDIFTFQYGGPVRKFQMGGPMMPPLVPIQAEKVGKQPEMIIHLDGTVSPTNATKRHKYMDDDEVTDIIPEGSFIASADKSMRITRDRADEIIMGIKAQPYKELKAGKIPEEVTLASLWPGKSSKKMTPAELVERAAKKYNTVDADEHMDFGNDVFIQATNKANLQSRLPYLAAIAGLNEEMRDGEQIGTYRTGGVAKYPGGGDVWDTILQIGSTAAPLLQGLFGKQPQPGQLSPGVQAGIMGGGALYNTGAFSNINAQRGALQQSIPEYSDLAGLLMNNARQSTAFQTQANMANTGLGMARFLNMDTSAPRYDPSSQRARLMNFQPRSASRVAMEAASTPNFDANAIMSQLGDRSGPVIAQLLSDQMRSRNQAATQRNQFLDNFEMNRISGLNAIDRESDLFNINQREKEQALVRAQQEGLFGTAQGGIQRQADLGSGLLGYNSSLASQMLPIMQSLRAQDAALTGQGQMLAGQNMMNMYSGLGNMQSQAATAGALQGQSPGQAQSVFNQLFPSQPGGSQAGNFLRSLFGKPRPTQNVSAIPTLGTSSFAPKPQPYGVSSNLGTGSSGINLQNSYQDMLNRIQAGFSG